MKKKLLTYKQSVDLVLTHLKATKSQWKCDGALRRDHYFPVIADPLISAAYRWTECCPITSLANEDAKYFQDIGRAFKLNKQAIEDIVAAADTTLHDMKSDKEYPYSKSAMDIRRKMDRIFRS